MGRVEGEGEGPRLWETTEAYLMGFKQINVLLIYTEMEKGQLSSFLLEDLELVQPREHKTKVVSMLSVEGVKDVWKTGNPHCVWGKNVIESNPWGMGFALDGA